MTTILQNVRWAALALSALAIAAYALAVLVVPGFGPPFIHERLTEIPWAVVGHLGGGALALFIGALQVNVNLRQRFRPVHRWMGRAYVVAVAAGGTGGLALATRSQGGFVAHVGFGLLAVLWLTATAIAYRHIRRGDQVNHRRWMLRSYSLTLAAVTLRIYIPASLAAGIQFVDAYQAIAWACWVPNLIVTEWWLLRPISTGPSHVAA